MKRAPDPLICTDTKENENTGIPSKKADIDEEDLFDIAIDDFDLPEGSNFASIVFEPFGQNHPRTHKPMIDWVNIFDVHLVSARLTCDSVIFSDNDSYNSNITINNRGEEEDGNAGGVRRDYPIILIFIEGALV